MTFSNLESLSDTLWVTLSSFLVFLMQAGFLCIEAGLTRRKNSIIAIKNITDLGISVIVFWAFGYVLMFGSPGHLGVSLNSFFPDVGQMGVNCASFFLFQDYPHWSRIGHHKSPLQQVLG